MGKHKNSHRVERGGVEHEHYRDRDDGSDALGDDCRGIESSC